MRLGDKTGWELEVTKPSTIGLYDFKFDDISLPNLPDQVETVGRLPGLHLHLPASEQWILTPFVDIGTRQGPATARQVAWIYSTGMESRYAFDWGKSRPAARQPGTLFRLRPGRQQSVRTISLVRNPARHPSPQTEQHLWLERRPQHLRSQPALHQRLRVHLTAAREAGDHRSVGDRP